MQFDLEHYHHLKRTISELADELKESTPIANYVSHSVSKINSDLERLINLQVGVQTDLLWQLKSILESEKTRIAEQTSEGQ